MLISVALGYPIGWTVLLSPIHELGHVLACYIRFAPARIVSWTEAAVSISDAFTLLAGSAMETLTFAAMAILVSRRSVKKWMTGGFWLGHAFGSTARAYLSDDFYRLAQLGHGMQGALEVWWTLFGLAVLSSSLAIVVKALAQRTFPALEPRSAGTGSLVGGRSGASRTPAVRERFMAAWWASRGASDRASAEALQHVRAAHLRLRAGSPSRAMPYIDRYLQGRPRDPYGIGLKGAALVLSGQCGDGERFLSEAEAMMGPRTRYVFRRNLRRVLAPGHGRAGGGFGESLLCTWLVVSDLNRERLDPRRQPPVRAHVPGRVAVDLRRA